MYVPDVPGGASGKEPACQCRRHKKLSFGPWFRKTPGGGHCNPLQYSCLENPMDRAWQAAVHRIVKSWAWLKQLSMHACVCVCVCVCKAAVPIYIYTHTQSYKAAIMKLCLFPFLCGKLLLLSCFSRVQLLVTPWTAAHQAPASMGFSRQECWSGLPLPSPKFTAKLDIFFS